MLAKKMISVLIAVKNEAKHLPETLKALQEQDYPSELLEIIIIDGNSTDETRAIAESFVKRFRNIRILNNPKELSAAGWNLGIKSAKGDVISILNGHVILKKDYYSHLIKYLIPEIAGVGGRAVPSGYNKRSEQISRIFQTQLGNGGATYIQGESTNNAETISFGCYWKKDLEEINDFDETIVRGQDWDLNMRLRKNGRKLLFVHNISVKYFVRDSLKSLWKRQFLAGYWKLYINRKSKRHFLLRHAIPGFFALIFTLLLLMCFINTTFICLFGAYVVLYLFAIIFENIRSKFKLVELPMTTFIYFIIHYAYGLGMIFGVGKR